MQLQHIHTIAHPQKISIISIALAFVTGVFFMQQLAALPDFCWLVAAFFFALVLFFVRFFIKFSATSVVLLTLVAVFLLGICWASVRAHVRLSDELPHAWELKPILVEGVVASVPEVSKLGERFQFFVEKILTPQAVVPKNIGLSFYYPRQAFGEESVAPVAYPQQFQAGERWRLSVRLKRPHGTLNPHGFDFEGWALAENLRATGTVKSKAGLKKLNDLVLQPQFLLERWRANIKQTIAESLKGKPYVGVIQALVMGDDSTINAKDWQTFLHTGTTHLMSISGLHITMLAGLAFLFVNFIWRRFPTLMLLMPTYRAGVLAGVVVAIIYALVAGFSIPTQRTLYMLLVFALAVWTGKKWSISQVLALALWVVVLLDPWAVIAAGFWLSFFAIAIITYALNGRLTQMHWFKSAVLTQWAVTIVMLPILIILFHQASIISPIANAVAIPIISFVVTPLALLGSFLSIDIFLNFAHTVLHGLMWVLDGLNDLPNAIWNQASPPTWTLLPALIGGLILLLPRGVPLRFLGIAGLIPMLFFIPEKPVVGEMKVTVLDVGQGLSVVIQTAGHSLLYDVGPRFNVERDAGNRIILPFLQGEGVRQLDGMIISHDDEDHAGGAQSVLQSMPVGWLLSSFAWQESHPNSIKEMRCWAGQHWVWDGVQFDILSPFGGENNDAIRDNNKSCVLKVSSRFGSVLMTGDIEKDAENALLQADDGDEKLKSDVLIVPHHGSKTSSQLAFVEAVAPQISIFTVGYLNRFGHPKADVLERYKNIGAKIYRSDHSGALQIEFMRSKENKPVIKLQPWRDADQRYWRNQMNLNSRK
jgi:competence protein ComEC